MLATRLGIRWQIYANWRHFTAFGSILFPFAPAWGASLLFVALIVLWRRNWAVIICDPLTWGLGAIAFWLGITTVTAAYPLEALGGLANFLPYFVFFLGFKSSFRHWEDLRQLAWFLVLPALPIAILGLGQLFWHWDSGEALRRLGFSLVAGGRPEGRLSSVFMYANLCAAYFLIVIPLAAGLGIDSWQQWQSDGNFKSRDRAIVLALGIIAASFSLLLTDSRSGWGIWVGIVTAFALYLGWRYLVMATAAATATIAWATWGSWGARTLRQLVPAFLWERLSDEEFGNRAENALRTTQWQFTFEMARQRPILGFGLRNFTPLYKQAMDLWLGHPHSLPLMLLGETGIPGLFLFLGWVGWIGARGVCLCRVLGSSPFREDRRHFLLLFSYLVAFASLGTYNLFDVTVFDLRMNLYGWLLLAAIAGIVQRHLPLRIHSSAREGG